MVRFEEPVARAEEHLSSSGHKSDKTIAAIESLVEDSDAKNDA